ncbi:hyaluronan and proteoglycan link protein 3-like [Brachyhypopomus gauderio]|uniref:hyaluronan and proteoglycan link protein 3-like n=1 Tax=Brachyhypopomus gauderio TaxID=698409 RepID=UPI004041D67F
MEKLRTLLALILQVLYSCMAYSASTNTFFYQDVFNANGNGEIHFNGIKLQVETPLSSVFALRGSNVTLPCRFWYEPPLNSPRRVRVKWSWSPVTGDREVDVLAAIGHRYRSFGDFKDRVYLQQDRPGDTALVITNVSLSDIGRYRCEVIDGLEDESAMVDLELRGVVFPYQSRDGRYRLTFPDAQQICMGQDATVATFDQLYMAWQEGLDWCNAGWLADGTVQYPINRPRHPCGGLGLAPGVRSYGARHKHFHHYDVFCFSSSLQGGVYYLENPLEFNFTEAVRACIDDGSQIATVGQLFAAWRFLGLDRCDAGWLADGSLRYPITTPRSNCGPHKPGVHSFGFPPQRSRHGVYCYSSR